MAIVAAGRWHIGLRQATSGDRRKLIWEQEAAGSNPAIPTNSRKCDRLLGAILVASICRPMLAGVAQRLRTLAPINSAELISHPAERTCVRLDANGLPVRGGAIPPLLMAGNATVIASRGSRIRSSRGSVVA